MTNQSLQDKDAEFLLWLAKRLVHKYGEDVEVIHIVEGIVHKNLAIKKSFNFIYNEIFQKMTQIISELKNEEAVLKKDVNDIKNKILLSKFEDLDLDQMLKK